LGPWATANYCRAVIKSLRGTTSVSGTRPDSIRSDEMTNKKEKKVHD
jgi:hypothetical protein